MAETSTTETRDVAGDVVGRTPWQITRARIRRDKVTLVAFGATIFFVLLALSAPVLTHFGLIDPYRANTDLVGGYVARAERRFTPPARELAPGATAVVGWATGTEVTLDAL